MTFSKPGRWMFSGLLFALLTACASTPSPDESLERLFGMGPIEQFTISSATLGRDFHVYVRLPQDYEARACDWPVVYLLDGGILFPMLSPYQLMLEIDEQAPPVVMVGISYGGLGYANGNLRSTDYTAPAPEPEYYGGAFAYQDFLAEELLPEIEGKFRVDADRSLVVGQSLGGQFTLLTALTRPELFSAYLSINPALHRNLDYFIELEPAEAASAVPLMITRSSEEMASLSQPLADWLAAWQTRGSDHLALELEWLEGHYHASSAPEAYRRAMAWWTAAGEACPP